MIVQPFERYENTMLFFMETASQLHDDFQGKSVFDNIVD